MMWDTCVCCKKTEVFGGMRCISCQVSCEGTECTMGITFNIGDRVVDRDVPDAPGHIIAVTAGGDIAVQWDEAGGDTEVMPAEWLRPAPEEEKS